MYKINRRGWLLPIFFLVYGCQSPTVKLPEQPLLSAPQKVLFSVPANVYSSYISEDVEQQCTRATKNLTPCKNDGIPSNDFLINLEQLGLFDELSPSVSRHDYELLIANQLTAVEATQGKEHGPALQQSFTEFSVEWRGVQLDTFLVRYWHENSVTSADVEQIILRWAEHAKQQNIFTTPYLYQAMGASDYSKHLHLPEQLGEFKLTQQYLYPDPFKGVLARYLHPTFTEAVLDIAIYPILSPLKEESALLVSHELENAVEQTKQIATERAMTMEINQHQRPFSNLAGNINGVMSEIAAQNDSGEALYASIYLFQFEDKFVKFTTTFPTRIGDPLVSKALDELNVPAESELMKALREAL